MCCAKDICRMRASPSGTAELRFQPQMYTDIHRSTNAERGRCLSLLSVSIRFHLWLILIAACCTFSLGQSGVRDYRRAHERQILDEFTRLLAIPNIASDKENIRRNAELIREMM